MTPPRPTLLMRHGALWGHDPWYRGAWLLGPQLIGLLAIAWLFAMSRVPDPPRMPGTWIHPLHGSEETTALKTLRDRAVTDPGALAELEAKAKGDNSVAQFFMGTLSDPKLHLRPPAPDDIGKAVAWYRRSAAGANDTAATNLGLLLEAGSQFGIATDIAGARALFTRAAPTYAAAQRELGLLRQRGWGEPEDPTGGFVLIREAAERGDAFSQRIVGEAYDRGSYGLPTDATQAVSWLQKAAVQGEALAERELAQHLKAGSEIAADGQAALEWFRKAAVKGDVMAQTELGNAAAKP